MFGARLRLRPCLCTCVLCAYIARSRVCCACEVDKHAPHAHTLRTMQPSRGHMRTQHTRIPYIFWICICTHNITAQRVRVPRECASRARVYVKCFTNICVFVIFCNYNHVQVCAFARFVCRLSWREFELKSCWVEEGWGSIYAGFCACFCVYVSGGFTKHAFAFGVCVSNCWNRWCWREVPETLCFCVELNAKYNVC